MVLFMAFGVSQNFQTSSDHKAAGATALGILYASFTASNFFASFIVTTCGAKTCLFVGSLTYVAFVAANIHYTMYILYLFSAMLGIGASVLWCAQGAYIANCATRHELQHSLPSGSTLGLFNGIFFTFFQCNNCIGSLLAALLFHENMSEETIFIVMTGIAAVGSLTLLGLKASTPITKEERLRSPPEEEDGTSVTRSPDATDDAQLINPTVDLYANEPSRVARKPGLLDSFRLIFHTRMLVLIPLMIFSGLSQTYFFGVFPPLVEDKSMKFFVLAMLGGMDAVSSAAMGKLSDKKGRVVVLLIGFISAASVIIFLIQWTVDQDATYIFFLCALLMGISDGVMNTQLYSILGNFFEGQEEAAFANFKLFQSGSTAIAYLYNDSLGLKWKSIITLSALGAGMILLTAYDLKERANGRIGSVFDSNGQSTRSSPSAAEVEESITQPDQRNSPMLAASDGSFADYTPQRNINGRKGDTTMNQESSRKRPLMDL